MTTDSQYVQSELSRFRKERHQIENAPLPELKEGAADLKKFLEEDFQHLLTQAQWIIDGSYGAGCQFAWQKLSKRMNRRAWLFNTYAIHAHRTNQRLASKVWHLLDTDLQAAINAGLDKIINEFDRRQEES